jgi:N-methylhydantoinase A
VTDADLLLGYLDPEFFLGGEIRLDRQRAEAAMTERIARPLGVAVTQAAEGVYRIINANMAAALRVVSVEKGYDPREFVLVVAGGAGPLHAGMIARELEIPLILVPRESSVFCAAGMLISDLQHDYVRTFTREWQRPSPGEINHILAELAEEGKTNLRQEGVADERVRIEASFDVRYVGQFHEVEVSAPMQLTADDLTQVEQRFHQTHDALYGYALPGAPLELINLRLRAIGMTEKPHFESVPFVGSDPRAALKGRRPAFFAGEWHDTPVYDGLKCEHGFTISGPALVEQPNTTILVPPGYQLVCDAYRNYVMYVAERRLEELLESLKSKT